jgi:hypothetical protein
MRANYSARRTSVVFNPRGRVLGGLGDGEGETGGGANEPGTGGNISGTEGGYAAGREIDAQIANEAALAAASKALDASKASNAATAKTMATIANTALGFMGPLGMTAGLISRATGFVENAFRDSLNNQQLSYDSNIKSAEQALADARGPAGSDATLTAEINKVQANIDAAKKVGIQAAVTTLYQTYAKRNPDPAALVYWSDRFGPTITADEVLAFQELLYANEPNLRPLAIATQTAAQPTNNLALPIIAAVAGFLLFGS